MLLHAIYLDIVNVISDRRHQAQGYIAWRRDWPVDIQVLLWVRVLLLFFDFAYLFYLGKIFVLFQIIDGRSKRRDADQLKAARLLDEHFRGITVDHWLHHIRGVGQAQAEAGARGHHHHRDH